MRLRTVPHAFDLSPGNNGPEGRCCLGSARLMTLGGVDGVEPDYVGSDTDRVAIDYEGDEETTGDSARHSSSQLRLLPRVVDTNFTPMRLISQRSDTRRNRGCAVATLNSPAGRKSMTIST